MSSIGIVILAAGASTRMGTPKQLLRYAGQTLLGRAVATALASRYRPVVVVVGAHRDRILPELHGLPVQSVDNPDWETGMGSSLRVGLEALRTETDGALDAVVFMLCDQPLLSPQHLDSLLDTYRETGCPLVASEYSSALGVPALFDRSLFPEILALGGAEGAKQILQRYRTRAVGVPFSAGSLDIDTPEDYTRLRAE